MSDEIKCVRKDRKIAYTKAEMHAEDPNSADKFARMDELFGGRVGGIYTNREGEPLTGLDMMRREIINSVFDLGEMNREGLNPTPENAHALGMLCAEVWGGWDNDKVSRALVRDLAAEIIRNEVGTGDLFDATGLDQLENALRPKLADYWHAVSNPPDDAPEGISWPDGALCELLRQTGESGKETAKALDAAARKRFETNPYAMFFDWSVSGLARYPNTIAKALWADQVKPQLERVRKNRPALPVPVYDRHITAVFTKGRVARKAESTDQFNLFSEGNMLLAQIPAMPPANLRRIIEAGTNEMRSTTSFRLINHLITQAHLRTYAGHQSPRVLRFDGGISALADAIGETSKPGRAKLESILEAGHQWQVEWPGGKAAGLWSYWYDDTTGPGKRAQLEITLGAPLSPRYAIENLGKGERFLVPIVPIAPLIRPFSNHIDQAIFQLLIVGELVTKRMQIAERGSAEITDARLQQLADQAGLSRKTWPRVIERWTRDEEPGDKGSAQGAKFLEKTGRNRYHLADNATYGLAKAFIDAGAKKALKGRKMGRRKKRIK